MTTPVYGDPISHRQAFPWLTWYRPKHLKMSHGQLVLLNLHRSHHPRHRKLRIKERFLQPCPDCRHNLEPVVRQLFFHWKTKILSLTSPQFPTKCLVISSKNPTKSNKNRGMAMKMCNICTPKSQSKNFKFYDIKLFKFLVKTGMLKVFNKILHLRHLWMIQTKFNF